MQKINTHYDNLKVTRNAPPKVIRAAYKSLSQKHHPDKNPDSPDAERVMSIINESYDVLSDADRRRQHDLWIAQKETVKLDALRPHSTPQRARPVQPEYAKRSGGWFFLHILRNGFFYVSCIITIAVISLQDKPKSSSNFVLYNSNPRSAMEASPKSIITLEHTEINTISATPVYTKSLHAPNNQPWPVSAGYVNGYPKLRLSGLSSVTIDNSQNNSAVFVKLASLESTEAFPIRHFYIPAFDKFTVNKVKAGRYDIRYRDLNSGDLSRSEPFGLAETKTSEGTQFSMYTLTLYKVENGNMQTYDLSEAEF